MITYEITKPIKKIHKLEIKSNVTLPYGVVMELQSLLSQGKVHVDLTKETIIILKHYENEMGDLDTKNLMVTGSFINDYQDDENHNEVEIQGDFL